MLKKRRFLDHETEEMDVQLAALVKKAAECQQICNTHDTELVYPGLPPQLSALNNLDSITALSSDVIEDLKSEVTEFQDQVRKDANDWENYAKQLKQALDLTLVLITLRSEQSHKRRKQDVDGERSRAGSPPSRKASVADIYEPTKLNDKESDATLSREKESNQPNNNSKDNTDSGSELTVGRQIAFKLPQSAVDEWIQCEITRIITPGYRFEVRDPEPDENGNPGKSYQCRIKDIMLLPLKGQSITPLPSGSIVLAQYPETTAFYKATVSSYNPKKRVYYLRFEGEEDYQKQTEVDDTLVLPIKR